jgi:tRNA-dihydrouridine synthase
VQEHLQQVDGVMLGRVAYHDPWLLATIDRELFGDDHPVPTRHEVLEAFLPYVERQLANGYREGAGIEVLRDAAAAVPRAALSAQLAPREAAYPTD